MVTLALLVGVGLVAAYALKDVNGVGDDVGHEPTAREILLDRGSPSVTQGRGDVTLIVFADYQCPACRIADREMRSAVASDGNVRVVYKDWPIFGPLSQRAAKVALAAARQGIYARVHHALMASPRLDPAGLRQAIESSGGDWQRVLFDLSHPDAAIQRRLETNARQAFSLGLGGTPGYLIGALRVRGALTKKEFITAFEEARAMTGN